MRLKFVIVALFFIAQVSLAGSWGLNDVSILFPLPTQADVERTLSPSSDGGTGALIAKSYLGLLPNMKGPLVVVGLRVDPCFPKIDTLPSLCRRQIRLIWQSLILGPTPSTVDSYFRPPIEQNHH